ncbi:hypothetical protein CK203_065698 [Vitis vinifera]|uniref:Reverse transcriptase RNase H-like domain-containing protein n=1 Tax=Vitis vinifera TaxID=29760 RepID=A0A438G2F0_VITVI|nr:hypothetical protein CK203_065698 [Vitis vinifera]
MCGGDFMSKNSEEAMDFLNYVAEVSRGWDEPNMGEVGRMKSQPNALNAKAGMYTLNEDIDMKAKVAAVTRRLEELELKKIRELLEKCLEIKQMLLDNSSPITMLHMKIPTIQIGGTIQISPGEPRTLQYMQPGQASQQASNLEQAIVNLSKKGRFPSQPHQNPKGIHEVEAHEGESSQMRDVKAMITLREWNGLMQLTFGNMTLELNIFYMCKKPINLEEEEGLPEPSDMLATLPPWRRIEEILPLFNEKETQEAVKEEAPKLILKPLPTELKYAYLEENKKCPIVISSSLTTPQEECLLEVLRRCKKAIGWQISNLKGINTLVCTHHIYMEEEAKPVRQPQRRLNPHMQEVVRAEVLKLLQAGIIYPISDSPWVSPTQVVPKNSGIIVVQNDKGEKVATCLTSGIVLDHIISKKDIEVDKAKVELIVKLPSSTTVKGGLFIVVFTDHSALKYLLTKQDAKTRLIRWILLLQKFKLQIKDKKGVENVVADHLSRLAIAHNSHGLPINDDFPEESLMLLEDAPWYAHIANYLVTGEVPNQIIRKCVPKQTTGDPQSLPRKHMWRPLYLLENSHEGVAIRFQLAITFQGCSYHSCLKFLKENIFTRFGVPKAIISDGVELANRKIKNILMKVVNTSRRDCLWQSMPSPCEVKYKAWWAIKKVNMDLNRAGMKRCLDLNEMEELRNDAYIYSKVAKQRMKRLHIFPGKLKSRWIGPFIIYQVHSNGVVELLNSNSTYTFKVNGHRLKPFMEPFNQDKEEVSLLKPQQS